MHTTREPAQPVPMWSKDMFDDKVTRTATGWWDGGIRMDGGGGAQWAVGRWKVYGGQWAVEGGRLTVDGRQWTVGHWDTGRSGRCGTVGQWDIIGSAGWCGSAPDGLA